MIVVLFSLLGPQGLTAGPRQAPDTPRPGVTFHWDFFTTPAEGERLLQAAIASGARVLNVVPPPHIWDEPQSLALLERVFERARAAGVSILLNRIDGSTLAGPVEQRGNWLYRHILNEPGRLPSGRATPGFFLATVGKPDYERWLREETRFYAKRFSHYDNLLGFSIGPFNEPFVSQRGSLLCWDATTGSYEIAQYTPHAERVWHLYLQRRFGGDLAAMNAALSGAFASFASVPMPRGETDPIFRQPQRAYWEFARAINAWVRAQHDACRHIWHAESRRKVPFVLQFSGYMPEKFAKGRPSFAALDVVSWMESADALGLSLYTNCEYPDWGHASDIAMVNMLKLGRLLDKKVYILECGNECAGAVLAASELRFISATAAELAPDAIIYEFLKSAYDSPHPDSSGMLFASDGTPKEASLGAVWSALHASRTLRPPAQEPLYAQNDLPDVPSAAALLARREIVRLAQTRSITFVPASAVKRLPRGARLIVPYTTKVAPSHAQRLRVIDDKTWLAEQRSRSAE
ncbi:MAG: hypothetical protein MUF51_08840 [Vicinamibacteria bacterium]|nr:hypothetical protein [Vicinamibacteria bacterium]